MLKTVQSETRKCGRKVKERLEYSKGEKIENRREVVHEDHKEGGRGKRERGKK